MIQRAPTAKQAYKSLIQDFGYCFACGRDNRQRPEGWYAPWRLERAHVAAGRSKMCRLEDRRAAIVLCGLCHLLHSTHGTGTATICGVTVPRLSNGNVLWLKEVRDIAWWDPDWLQERWTGVMPARIPPADWFIQQYEERWRL